MNLERFDKITKDRCCILPVEIQLKTGYKTRKQFTSSINSIYKSVRNQRDFGGAALASAPLINIARLLIEGTEEPIRVEKLEGEADPPIRPMADTYKPFTPISYKGKEEATGSKTPRELELESLLREARSDVEYRKVGEMTLEKMRAEQEEKADELEIKNRIIEVAKKYTNESLKAEYRSLLNLTEGQTIPASYSAANKVDKIKILINEGLSTLESLEQLIGGGIAGGDSVAGDSVAGDDSETSSIGTVSEVVSEGARTEGDNIDYPE